jgi:hypothetical protein
MRARPQLVQGGFLHAPVGRLAGVLQVLQAARHTPGKHFMKNYAHVSAVCCACCACCAWCALCACHAYRCCA